MQAVKLVCGVTPTCWRVRSIPPFAIYGLSISFFGPHSLLLVMLMIVFVPLLKGWDSEPFFGITIQMIGRLEKPLVSLLRQWTACIRSWLMMLPKANLIPWVLFHLCSKKVKWDFIDRCDGPRTRAQRFHDERGDEVLSSSQKCFQSAFPFTLCLVMQNWRHVGTKNIVPVATAFNISNPYPETNYTMPTFSQCTLYFSFSFYEIWWSRITLVDLAGNTTTTRNNITSSPNSTGTAQARPSVSSNVANGPGNNNNLGANNNRASNNAVALGLNFANVRGVVKVVGAFLLAGAGGFVGVGFLG